MRLRCCARLLVKLLRFAIFCLAFQDRVSGSRVEWLAQEMIGMPID
jgi:hypothetical protein